VRHIDQVLDWALGNYHDANGLTVDKRVALVADVRAKLVPHAQQLISGGRGRMAASMGLDIGQVDQDLAVLCAENERAKVATTQLQQAHAELSGVREEASRGSTALAAAHSELAEEVRLRTQLQQHLIDLKAELQAAQEELAHMHAPGPLLSVEEDASMNETRDQVI
jgi:chromosome segregation ATPase